MGLECKNCCCFLPVYTDSPFPAHSKKRYILLYGNETLGHHIGNSYVIINLEMPTLICISKVITRTVFPVQRIRLSDILSWVRNSFLQPLPM